MYDLDKVIDRKQGNARKWSNEVLKEKFGLDEDAIPMDLADIDFEVAPAIQAALMKRASIGDYSYSYVPDEFYQAVIDWNQRRYETYIEKEWIKLTFGTVSTLHYIVQAYTEIGDGVLINTPAYDPFAEAVEHNQRTLFCSSLINRDNRYYLDFADMERQMQENKIKLFIFCSPQNPSGRIWTKDELFRLAELCIRYDVLLVCDEIHRDIVYKGQTFTSIWNAHSEIAQHSVLCLSPNKGFNLGGLKTSYVVIPNPQIRETLLDQLQKNSITSPHVFAVPAIVAAYNESEAWLDEMIDYVAENMQIVYDFFTEIPEAKVMSAESSFLAWIDVRKWFKDETDMQEFFRRANLTMVVGSYFVQDGEGFVRLSIGMPRELLLEALGRIKKEYVRSMAYA
ncbi:pyridoxal phosphate-dependent aminotransferase [Enterococcus raffinosus]|uniref:MalY/PatB family protein n=1 Tax=Enterococcus raffinosus TaxID=71452 RepID=UPI001C10DE20|nr:MalY/PatB family protein [Enterococcus raffinosus]MBU5362503.1 pyridoxal phosphate-dependent aminotransferase [Enterococcus raffinosus]